MSVRNYDEDGIERIASGASNIIIDDELSDKSPYPVENQAVTKAINSVAGSVLTIEQNIGNVSSLPTGNVTGAIQQLNTDLANEHDRGFLSQSGNLFVFDDLVQGTLNETTGIEEPSGIYKRTPYMNVISKAKYSFSTRATMSWRWFWFDKNKNLISTDWKMGSYDITAPNNAKYVRLISVSFSNTDTLLNDTKSNVELTEEVETETIFNTNGYTLRKKGNLYVLRMLAAKPALFPIIPTNHAPTEETLSTLFVYDMETQARLSGYGAIGVNGNWSALLIYTPGQVGYTNIRNSEKHELYGELVWIR